VTEARQQRAAGMEKPGKKPGFSCFCALFAGDLSYTYYLYLLLMVAYTYGEIGPLLDIKCLILFDGWWS